jgi:hypothetical protein
MTAGPGDTRGSQLLIGIDDTDNLGTRGTGHLAERLLLALRHAGFGSATGATRHQLLVDPQIPYTSHNSSMCIGWDGEPGVDAEAIAGVAGPFLETASAPGSDPGLAIAVAENWSDPRCRQELVDFGHRAKREVLNRSAAFALAALCGVSLSAHGGDGGGVIGALAAVGLHLSGDDGRFRWMPGLRDLAGFLSYDELPSSVPITERATRPDVSRRGRMSSIWVTGSAPCYAGPAPCCCCRRSHPSKRHKHWRRRSAQARSPRRGWCCRGTS